MLWNILYPTWSSSAFYLLAIVFLQHFSFDRVLYLQVKVAICTLQGGSVWRQWTGVVWCLSFMLANYIDVAWFPHTILTSHGIILYRSLFQLAKYLAFCKIHQMKRTLVQSDILLAINFRSLTWNVKVAKIKCCAKIMTYLYSNNIYWYWMVKSQISRKMVSLTTLSN